MALLAAWLAAGLLVAGCAQVAVREVPVIEVELDAFSGRPNPRWTLSITDAEELARRLAELPPGEPPDEPPALGYRGFELTNPGEVGDLPPRIRVYAGGVSLIGDDGASHYRDERGIEAWLIGQARSRGLQVP